MTLVRYRRARREDAAAIAALHADSWRHHNRGMYSDAFLDGAVDPDRLVTWTSRAEQPRPDVCVLVAEAEGVVVGFSYTIGDEDPDFGSMLENLHVERTRKGHGIGTRLMATTAEVLLERGTAGGLYLWVLEPNTAARAFYEARGGRCVERRISPPPGGDPAHLVGAPRLCRYVWPDLADVLVPRPAGDPA
jgi:GNAT superfamily N-acetyltransferase